MVELMSAAFNKHVVELSNCCFCHTGEDVEVQGELR